MNLQLQGTSIQVFAFLACFLFVAVIVAKEPFYQHESSHFDIVLSNILRKSVDQLSTNKYVKRAVKSLKDELIEDRSGQETKKPQVRQKKGSDDIAGHVHDLLDTVESFFSEEGIGKSEKKKASKENNELVKFLTDFQFFVSEVQGNTVNSERIRRLILRGFTLMSSRPQLLKNVAMAIEDLSLLPKELTDMLNIEKILGVVSQLIAFWNSPVGQKMIKPMIDNTMQKLVETGLDVNSIKPAVDLLLTTTLDIKTRKQIQPFVDVFFRVAGNLIQGLKKAGYENAIKNFRVKRLLKEADEAYLDFMAGTMDTLLEALENTESTLLNLDTVSEVIRKYRDIPGTLDKRFQQIDLENFDDPVIKVNSIVTHIKKAIVVVKQSKVAILRWEPYPLQHPALAIDAVKEAMVALDEGDRMLQEIWPLKGYLRTHPAVKRHVDIRLEVAQVKSRMQRAIDKTHKLAILIQDLKNMDSIFDVIYIYKDVRAVLYGQPRFSLVVAILDIFGDEMEKMKEIAYNGY